MGRLQLFLANNGPRAYDHRTLRLAAKELDSLQDSLVPFRTGRIKGYLRQTDPRFLPALDQTETVFRLQASNDGNYFSFQDRADNIIFHYIIS